MHYYEHVTKDVWDAKYVIPGRRNNNWSSKTVGPWVHFAYAWLVLALSHTRVEELFSKLCKNFKEVRT